MYMRSKLAWRLLVVFALAVACALLAYRPAGADDERFPPWQVFDDDCWTDSTGFAGANCDSGSNSVEGGAWAMALAGAAGGATAQTEFNHGDSWACPDTGDYEIWFTYNYDGEALLESTPFSPLPTYYGEVRVWAAMQYHFGLDSAIETIFEKELEPGFWPQWDHYPISGEPDLRLGPMRLTAGEQYAFHTTVATFVALRALGDGMCSARIDLNGRLTRVTIRPLHTVSMPNRPSGPDQGTVGVSWTFCTGGSVDSQGHSVQYRFDWGDGSYSNWSSSTCASHTWSNQGTYTVKAEARCPVDHSLETPWSDGKPVTITGGPDHTVSTPRTPVGPDEVIIGIPWAFCTMWSRDSLGHDVEYRFDWGDGTYSNWLDHECEQHTWTDEGSFVIKAQARCSVNNSITSPVSDGKLVIARRPGGVSQPDRPWGPGDGVTGEELPFCTGGAVNNRGHPVEYRFDWGDGSYSSWSSSLCAMHAWDAEGDYPVKAQARCSVEQSITSPWSDAKSVTITCVLVGDLDGDGDVDVDDIMQVASRWRTTCDNPDPDNDPDTPNYEARYDLDHDCDIDVVDIMLVAVHWGDSCED